MNLDGDGAMNLTQSPSEDIHSTVSPNGGLIVFRSDRSGKFEAHTMSIDGSQVTQLTDLQGSVRHPSFSPDGNQVIFHAVTKPGSASIQMVDLQTRTARELASDSAANLNAV